MLKLRECRFRHVREEGRWTRLLRGFITGNWSDGAEKMIGALCILAYFFSSFRCKYVSLYVLERVRQIYLPLCHTILLLRWKVTFLLNFQCISLKNFYSTVFSWNSFEVLKYILIAINLYSPVGMFLQVQLRCDSISTQCHKLCSVHIKCDLWPNQHSFKGLRYFVLGHNQRAATTFKPMEVNL